MKFKIDVFFAYCFIIFITIGMPAVLFGIDPIKDFRSPKALTEKIHEGLVEILSNLESSFQEKSLNETAQNKIVNIELKLVALRSLYEESIDQSKLNSIHFDDISYLQKMIERISVFIDAQNILELESIQSQCKLLSEVISR